MYTGQSKKMLPLVVMDILRKYTDVNHTLSQKEISSKIQKEYGISADRKTITRLLKEMIDFYDEEDNRIGYSVETRLVPIKDETTGEYIVDSHTNKRIMEPQEVLSDFYMDREITDSELRIIIDALLFSMHISYTHRKDLINKLCGLSNKYFKSRVKHIACISDEKNYNISFFNNIEIIDQAISKKRKVSFNYTEYKVDKKIHIKKGPDGKNRVYIISPYQMVARDDKYYLICNYDKYDDISNYRVDRIKNIKILDEKVKPFEKLTWSNSQRLDLKSYMKEHIYMYSSKDIYAKLRIKKAMVSDIIDMFGVEVRFSDEDEVGVTVTAKVNEQAVIQFAKNYGPDVEILEPREVREQVKEELEKALEVYRR